MAKTKTPVLGFSARGTLADSVTFQRRDRGTITRRKPSPSDPKSLAQTYHRWLYQDYAAWWNTLTPAEQRQWESDARRRKITGFNLWMSEKLVSLPDIMGGWHLDRKVNGYAIDFSKNSNNGVVYGTTLVDGVIDHALNFDGVDDVIKVSDFDHTFTAMTVLFRAKIAPHAEMPGSNRWILFWNFYWGTYGLSIYKVLNQNTIYVRLKNQAGVEASRTITFTPNEWFMGGFIWTGTNLYSVKDTVISAATAFSGTLGSDKHLYIGAFSLAEYFLKAGLDEVVIYDRALTQQDINTHSERRYP